MEHYELHLSLLHWEAVREAYEVAEEAFNGEE